MTHFVASIGLLVMGSLITLGNFWFTYGIWPRSWGSFALFAFLTCVLVVLHVAIKGEKK